MRREICKREIFLTREQKKTFRDVVFAVSELRKFVMNELIRQHNTMFLYQSPEGIKETVLENSISNGLLETTIQSTIRKIYDQFVSITKISNGNDINKKIRHTSSIMFEIPKDFIIFNGSNIEIPYLGSVSYRKTRSPQLETLHKMANRISIGNVTSTHFIQFDCRAQVTEFIPALKKRRRLISD